MKKVLTLTLVLTLLLTLLCGCGNTAGTEAETGPASDAVVARVYGTDILYTDLAAQMASVEAMYQSLSGSLSAEEISEKLEAEARNVLNNLISDAILDYEIAQYGITLTKEEEAQAQAQWDAVLDQMLASIRLNYPTMSEKDQEAMVVLALQNSSVNEDMVLSAARKSILTEKLRAAATEGITAVTEDAVQDLYDTLLSEQKAEFETDPTAFEAAMLGKTVVVYIPRNYRVIQELTIKSSDDVIGLLKQMEQYDNEESDSYEEMLANEQTLRSQLIAAVRSRCAAGEPFADVVREVVPGVSLKTNYICDATTRFSEDYYSAAMSIPMEGGLSDTVLPANYGCTLLCWEKTLPAGEVSLAQVADTLRSQLEAEAENTLWKDLQQQWLEEASITIYDSLLSY